jgi:hypothetical protein
VGAIACRLELTPEKDAARQYIMIVGVYAPWRDRYAGQRRCRHHETFCFSAHDTTSTPRHPIVVRSPRVAG